MSDRHSLSLFSQRLDRVAYVAWFLGAIVPLAALAIVVATSEDAVAAHLGAEGVTLVISAAVLCLSSFFMLRRMTRRTLERMDDDAVRLSMLLNACTALSGATSAREAASVAATYAARLARARAAFVVSRRPGTRGFDWNASAGDAATAVMSRHAATLEALAAGVVADARPAMRVPMPAAGPGEWIAPTTVAVPFITDAGLAVAALIVVHGDDAGRFEAQQLDGLLTLAGLASVALANADLRRALAMQHLYDGVDGAEDRDRDLDTVPAGVA